MPISDYASAFFFARRKRVTLSGLGTPVARSRLLFQKPARSITGINIVAVIAGFVNPSSYILQKNLRRNPGQSEFREAETGSAEADETEEARRCRASLTNISLISSFRELCDLMGEPRDLSARIVLVDDVALRGLHEFRFRTRHRLQRRIAVAALDRLFDNADRAAHLGATRLVDNGAAGNLARRLLGGGGIGHAFKYPSAVTDRGCSGLSAPAVQPRDRRW